MSRKKPAKVVWPEIPMRDRLFALIQEDERAAELRGLERGLAVAEKIVIWLTGGRNVTKKLVREWAQRAIAKERERA